MYGPQIIVFGVNRDAGPGVLIHVSPPRQGDGVRSVPRPRAQRTGVAAQLRNADRVAREDDPVR